MKYSPQIYRLPSICRTPHPEGGQQVTAKLYSYPEIKRVEWWSQNTDIALTIGTLVSIEGALCEVSAHRSVILGRLIPATTPNPELNLFETIPPDWQVEGEVRDWASKLWIAMPLRHRCIFNQIFWSRERFHRYITARRRAESKTPISHLAWVVAATRDSVNRATMNKEAHLAELILTGLLLDAGSLEDPSPRSYVQVLEWLLSAHREIPVLDDDLLPRLTWQVVQVHGLIDQPRTVIESDLLETASFRELQ